MSLPPNTSDEEIICTICENIEADPRKVLECVCCHACHHFKCKKIIGNAVRKMRNKDYFCSSTCQEMHLKSANAIATEGLLIEEFKKVVNEIKDLKNEQRSTRKELVKAINEIEASQNFLGEKFEEMCSSFSVLKNEQHTLKQEVESVQDNYNALKEVVNRLEEDVDRFSREGLSKNAILLGIPMTNDENAMDIVAKFAAALHTDFVKDAVTDAKRLHDSKSVGRCPPIKIVFSDVGYKEKLFAKKKETGLLTVAMLGGCYADLPGRITIRDEMTPHGMAMLREVKDMQPQLDLKFVWPGRNGVILVKKAENSKLEYIRNRNDLQKLSKLSSKRALDMSIGNTSGIIEPEPKRR